jgi:O-glycosyl hydrolase
MMNALLYGDVSLVTPWQAVGASPSTHDLAGLEGPTKKTFVAAQFFRHIRPGMTRVQITQPRDPGASCVAFRSPSGERVVVVFVNRQEKQVPVSLEVSGAGRTRALAFLTDAARNHSSVDLNPKSLLLPPESVLTLVLQVSQLG